MRLRVPLFLGLAAALAGAALWISLRGRVRMSEGPLPQDAYVWQRAWGDPVRQAILSMAPDFRRYVALAAEVTWSNGQPRVVRVPVDWTALSKLSNEAGLALRIGTYPGPFAEGDAASSALIRLSRELTEAARAQGLRPSEFQVDFDCAESKLSGYQVWLRQLRTAVAPVPLTLTTLPSWLKRRDFTPLVREADGFVLQVHSFARPSAPESPFLLCDPAAAEQAVMRAARIGVPFRVALPTYGYVIAFGRDGRFLGLAAEGPDVGWPPDARLREVRAREQDMQVLAGGWQRRHPEALQGILWYRLPVEGDRMNWAPATLSAVVRGKPLEPVVAVEKTSPEPGLVEIDLLNRGTLAVIAPVQITMRWRGGRLVAADGLAGYSAETGGPGSVQFSPPSQWRRLEPGSRRRIGWARFPQPTEVSLETSTAAP